MEEFLLWATIFVLGNIFDIITTYWGSKDLTKSEMQSRELNPFARGTIHKKWLMILGKVWVVSFVLFLMYRGIFELGKYIEVMLLLKTMSLMMVFVVVNNAYANWARKHGRLSVGLFLVKRLHFPGWSAFVVLLGFIGMMSYGLVHCLF